MDDFKLLTDRLPNRIVVGGKTLSIDTRWHVQLDISDFIADPKKTANEKMRYCASRFLRDAEEVGSDMEYLQVFLDWQAFFSCADPRLDKGRTAIQQKRKCFDFWNDARLIIAGFQQAYGIDLFTSDMHWWRFLCLLEGLPASTRVMERIALRGREPDKGKYADAKANQALHQAQQSVRVVSRYDVDEATREERFQSALNKLEF